MFVLFCFFFKGLSKGRRAKRASKASERSSPVLLALVLELMLGCLSSMPGLVSMFLYIGITCAEISYIKLGLSLAFSCLPLPDLIYHIGTCLKSGRASRSLPRQVFSCFNSWEASGASPTSEAIISFLLLYLLGGERSELHERSDH